MRPSRAKPGKLKICEECQDVYRATRITQRFCSRPCKAAWHNRQYYSQHRESIIARVLRHRRRPVDW